MSNFVINQDWKYYLKRIQEKMGPAIIAGGAIRDTKLNKPITDVDIFVQTTKKAYDLADIMEIASTTNKQGVNVLNSPIKQLSPSASCQSTLGRTFTKSVQEITKDGTIYQIISVNCDPVEYVEKYFDFGICKAYYDGHKTFFSKEFNRDVKNNTLTLCGEVNKEELYHSLTKHIPKLLAKYPGRTIVLEPDKII